MWNKLKVIAGWDTFFEGIAIVAFVILGFGALVFNGDANIEERSQVKALAGCLEIAIGEWYSDPMVVTMFLASGSI